MASLLFFNISRGGLTWVVAASPPPPGAAVARGGPADLARAAAGCGAAVAWDARRQLAALAARVPALAGVTPVELGEIAGAAPAATYDAGAVADAYFAAGAPAVTPSAEQWAVANATARGLNVLCRAVAGAGKTTTLLFCAGRAPARAHLLLTYNKRLQVDVARRAQPNVAAMTYHAAAGRAYGTLVRNDEQLRGHVRAGAPETPPRFDVLLIDESQDMAVEYFALVRHLLAANPGARLVVVGDELQSINEYRGAHPGFLTEAPALYGGEWASCRLGVSHRLTPATAAFVNTHLYRAAAIVGGNHRDADRAPLYIAAAGKAAVTRALAAAVKEAISEFGPAGVFVLAPSVRDLATKQSPVAELVRRHLAGVPVFVAENDNDEALTRGKLAVLSFNAVKGCERPCVVVVGLDETYFRFFNREWADPRRLPNILAVAATRAISRLVVIAAAKDTLRTVDAARLAETAAVRGAPAPPRRPRAAAAPPRPRKTTVPVARLVRHLHPETVRDAAALIVSADAAGAAAAPRDCPRPAGRVVFGATAEDLSFVYGTLAVVLAEVARRGSSGFGAGLAAPEAASTTPFGNQITAGEYAAYPAEFRDRVAGALATRCADRSPAEWAALAVAHSALREGRHHVARQVTHYDWVDAAALAAVRDVVVRALAGRAGEFWAVARATVGLKTVVGVADFLEDPSAAHPDGVVWEFRLGELCEEQELELACKLAARGGGEGRLVSILCREARDVAVAAEDAAALLATVVERTPVPPRPVAQLIADFDAGCDVGAADDGAADDADDAGAWGLEDVF